MFLSHLFNLAARLLGGVSLRRAGRRAFRAAVAAKSLAAVPLAMAFALGAPIAAAQTVFYPSDLESEIRHADLIQEPHRARGIHTDGSTMWVGDAQNTYTFTYPLTTAAASAAFNFLNTAHTNVFDSTRGMWSDGTTMWFATDLNNTASRLYSYGITGGGGGKDITPLATGNTNPTGVWSDGTIIYVADEADNKIYAYTLEGGTARPADDITLDAGNTDPKGLWSDGTTMYVSDATAERVFAYTITSKARDMGKEIDISAVNDIYDITGHGRTLYVLQGTTDMQRIFAYNLDTRARVANGVYLAFNAPTVREGGGLVFTVRALNSAGDDQVPPGNVTFQWTVPTVTMPGEGIADGSDVSTSGPESVTLTPAMFMSGGAVAAFTVQTMTDAVNEPDEMLKVTIHDLSDNARFAANEAASMLDVTGTITEGPKVSIAPVEMNVSEGGYAVFEITAAEMLADSLSVTWDVSPNVMPHGEIDGPVIAVGQRRMGTVRLPAGTGSSARLTIRIADDNVDEGGATALMIGGVDHEHMADLNVSIDASLNTLPHVLGVATATVRIGDNDHQVISIRDGVGTESSGSVPFTVSLSHRSTKTITVDYATSIESGDTAEPNDLTTTSGTLTFMPGDREMTFNVPVTEHDMPDDDTTDQDLPETFTMTLSNPSHAAFTTLSNSGVAQGRIFERPTVNLAAPSAVMEGENLEVTLTLVGDPSRNAGGNGAAVPVSVTLQASENITNFPAMSNYTIPAGNNNTVSFVIPTFDNNIDEADREMRLSIALGTGAPSGFGADTAVRVITVRDDDEAPQVFVADARADDTDSEMVFIARFEPRERTSDSAITFDYRTSGGAASLAEGETAAMAGTHYGDASGNMNEITGTLTFMPGESEQRIVIPILPEDDGNEVTEVFSLVLENLMPAGKATFFNDRDNDADMNTFTALGRITEGLDEEQKSMLNKAVAPRVAAVISSHVSGIIGNRISTMLRGSPIHGGSARGLTLNGVAPGQFAAQEIARGGVWDETNAREKLRYGREDIAFAMGLNGGLPRLDLGSLTLWGQGYVGGVKHESDEAEGMSFDGDVKGALIGMDRYHEGTVMGIAFNRAEAELDFELAGIEGMHTTELSGVHPYIGRELGGGLRLWGGMGINRGEMEVVEDSGSSVFNVSLHDIAFGGSDIWRIVVDSQGEIGRLEIGGDIQHTRVAGTPKDAAGDRAEAFHSDASKARAGITFTHDRALPDGFLSADARLSMRYDDGEGVATGAGVEIGGGVEYTLPGLAVNLNAYTLAGNDELEEWNVAAGVSYHSRGWRGFGLSFRPEWGGAPGDSATAGIAGVRYQFEATYGIGLARDTERVVLFARDGYRDAAHHYGVGADYHLGDNLTAGYEAVIERDADTDQRGYLRYQRRF